MKTMRVARGEIKILTQRREKNIFSVPQLLTIICFSMSEKRILEVAAALCFNLGNLCLVVKNSFELLAKWRLLSSPLSK